MNKQKLVALLKGNLEKDLFAVAKNEVTENPRRDEITQSMFVIHKLEEFVEEMESRLLQSEGENLTEQEISSIVHESIGNVMRVLFKGII